MKKFICAILIALSMGIGFSAFVLAGSVSIVGNDLITGMKFLENDPSSSPNIKETYDYGFYRGYVLGVYDSWGVISLRPDLKFPDVPPDMTRDQFWSIVDTYFRNHPQEWNRAVTDLVNSAVNEAFPETPKSEQTPLKK